MNALPLDFSVATDLCISCGACVTECPRQIIHMDTYPELHDPEKCMRCQHCLAVCPVGAISILGHDPAQSTLLEGNLPEPEQLATLIKGRRSVRQYSPQDLAPELLRSILNTAGHAPTGTNSQQLLITLIDKRSLMDAFRNELYQRLDEMVAQNRLPASRLRPMFMMAPELWKAGQDPIFRGAPHCLIVSNSHSASCMQEDPFIYLSYFELAAQSSGVGTVWCGLLHYCLSDILPELQQKLGIPDTHNMGYSMLFGYPNVKFYRTVPRTTVVRAVNSWSS